MADSLIPAFGPVVVGQAIEIRPGRILDVAYQPGSRPDAPVLFFCHGAGGNKDQWRAQWQALAAAGYPLVALDLLGHGASEKPDIQSAYAWQELVEDYLEVLRRYRGKHNLLIAHSFGTGLTLSALVQLIRQGQAAGIDGLVLLGTVLKRPQLKPGVLSLPVWILRLLRPWLAKGFRERAWHPAADPALIDYEEKLTENNPLYVFKALSRQALWPTREQLDSLQLPVSVVSGDQDGLTPASGGEALARHLANAEFQVLAQCGHQLMLERPEQVLNAITRLLETTATAPRAIENA
ncbi:alpha/beta fold hydrolase [Pseudomonas sp. Pseusp122]|uniref:alpha/beta fold hydrolase n=1 Tax=unclassified Pseudomonas TaxID=196821 RepID=UPI0039A6634C